MRSYLRVLLALSVATTATITSWTAQSAATSTTTVLLADSMTRSATVGWGTPDTGATYSLTHAGQFAVDGSRGRMTVQPNAFETATVGGMPVRDVHLRLTFAVKTLPVDGSGTYLTPAIRAADNRGYRMIVRIAPGGGTSLTVARVEGATDPVVQLKPWMTLPDTTAGAAYQLAFSAMGNDPVALAAKVWKVGTQEPSFQWKFTDQATQRVTVPGAVQVTASASGASQPAVVFFDDLSVIGSTEPTVTPTATTPTTPTTPTTATTATSAAPSTTPGPVTSTTAAVSTTRPPTSATSTSVSLIPATSSSLTPTSSLPVPPATVPSVSSSATAAGAAALVDGTVAAGRTGSEWSAASGDAQPWAQLSFARARPVASVQIFGTSANWVNPINAGMAPMYGTLLFSDGSTVMVSGIAGGPNGPTTIAFAPRTVSWVRLLLKASDPQVRFGLREFAVYDVGTTPPRWPSNPAPRYSVPAIPAVPCNVDSPAVGTSPDSSPALVCPKPGTAVSGATTVVVSARPGAVLTANAWLPATDGGVGSVGPVGTAVTDAKGRAVFVIDAGRLTAGPTAIRFTTAAAADRPLYVQLDNAGGLLRPAPDAAPAGMTLQWNDDFRTPVSITQKGAGADYAATKPSYTGGGDFGDAVFADPASGLNTIATVDSNFLRIRLQPSGSYQDPYGWGRTHVAGIVSSAAVGGSGFSAQYGYFEARMLAPAGYGSWPAFWLLNGENTANRETAAAEFDTVELYGQFPLGSCHSLHAWNQPGNSQSVCPNPNGASDWALSWHTYAASVKPDRIDYYIDHRLVATTPGPKLTDEPFFFLLDQSLGGGWPEKLTGTGDTLDLYVDWVRVYT